MLNLRANLSAKTLVTFLALALLLALGSLAASPQTLPKPTVPTIAATGNPGELQVTWTAAPGAKFYTVAYFSMDELKRLGSEGKDIFDAFYMVTIAADRTAFTVRNLDPDLSYSAMVGAHTERFGQAPVWSDGYSLPAVAPAGAHGAGFCPITGLPIPADGYLKVGDTKTWTDSTFRLDSVTSPASVATTTGAYAPPKGRKLLLICGTQSNQTGGKIYFQSGTHNNLATDRGIGFSRVTGWGDTPIPNGETESACDAWEAPASAATAVYAINDGARPDVLYRIDLTTTPTTLVKQTPFNLTDFNNGPWLSAYHPQLAEGLKAMSWVRDGVTETESEAVQQLLYLAVYDAAAMGQVLRMPFLQTFQTADRHAVYGITEMFRDGLGQTLTQTRIYRNGITDAWTPSVVAAATTASVVAITEYLNAGQVTTETKTYSTSHTDSLTVSIVRQSDATPSTQTANALQTAAQLTESIMGLPLPTDHVIVVFDDQAVTPGYWGVNHGFAIGVTQDSETVGNDYQRESLQNHLHHEVSHYWWRGNADWIDEGLADTIAATASLAQGAGGPAQPNLRKNCTARNLSEIGEISTVDAARFYCNYYLGEKLFRDLQSRMTVQDFTTALQNLYRASRDKPAPTQPGQVRADIADVRNAFAAHADVVEYYWSGDVNTWDPDDNVYKGHNVVEWTQKPTYSNGIVSFSGRLTGPATLSKQTLPDAQQGGGYSNFSINDSDGNYLGSILPPLPGNSYWNLDDPWDVVADTYQLNGKEFSVSFRWPGDVGEYSDKRVLVWGFNNADRTPQSGSNVDLLSSAAVR